MKSVMILPFAVSLALVLCCGEGGLDTYPIQATEQAIVNGSPDSNHPSVGKITTNTFFCTGTLIGKKTVLTAGHCIAPGLQHTIEFAGTFYVATAAIAHPDYSQQWYGPKDDVGLLILADSPPLTPVPLAGLAPELFAELELVGFGAQGESGPSGEKQHGKNYVAWIDDSRLGYVASFGPIANICPGDSGGPSFATVDGIYSQVGVHSSTALGCGVSGFDMRVDKYLSWIQQASQGDVVFTEPPAEETTEPDPEPTAPPPADPPTPPADEADAKPPTEPPPAVGDASAPKANSDLGIPTETEEDGLPTVGGRVYGGGCQFAPNTRACETYFAFLGLAFFLLRIRGLRGNYASKSTGRLGSSSN